MSPDVPDSPDAPSIREWSFDTEREEPVPAESAAALTDDTDPAGSTVLTTDLPSSVPTSDWPPAPEPPPAKVEPRVPLSHTFARIGEELVAWFKTFVSAAVYATLIVTFGFQVARVEGESMAPTLEDQDRLIVNKLVYRLPNHNPRVGDIVMLLYPNDPDKSFVKRIVAEPGDTLRIVNGQVYRNDVPLPDDFIPEEYRSYETLGPEIVPDAHYYVMGDHRNNSNDSRTWKFVPKKYIIGRVQLRWWPLTEARMFSEWD